MNAPVKSRSPFPHLLQGIVNAAWHANRVIRRNWVLRYLFGMTNLWLASFVHWKMVDYLGGLDAIGFPGKFISFLIMLTLTVMVFRVSFQAFRDAIRWHARVQARIDEIFRNRTPGNE